MMTPHPRRTQTRPIAPQGLDWFATVFWAIVLAALLLGAVAGHSAVSVAHGQMPRLQVEQFLVYVAKGE